LLRKLLLLMRKVSRVDKRIESLTVSTGRDTVNGWNLELLLSPWDLLRCLRKDLLCCLKRDLLSCLWRDLLSCLWQGPLSCLNLSSIELSSICIYLEIEMSWVSRVDEGVEGSTVLGWQGGSLGLLSKCRGRSKLLPGNLSHSLPGSWDCLLDRCSWLLKSSL